MIVSEPLMALPVVLGQAPVFLLASLSASISEEGLTIMLIQYYPAHGFKHPWS